MRGIADRFIVRTVSLLKRQPEAFRFVKKHLDNTALHRLLKRAKRRVELHAAATGVPVASLCGGHWDRNVAAVEGKELKGWLDWEFIEVEHIRPQVSGDKSTYYLQHFFRSHLPRMPVERALSLGCGGGNLERALIALGAAKAIDAYDASPESIRLANELAAKARQTLTDSGYPSLPREVATSAPDGFWVYLESPPQETGERRLLDRLKRGGINDAQVVGEPGARRISLGVFSDEERAASQSEKVAKLGLLPQIEGRTKTSSAIWLDLKLKSGAQPLEGQKFQAGDAELEFRPCPPATH